MQLKIYVDLLSNYFEKTSSGEWKSSVFKKCPIPTCKKKTCIPKKHGFYTRKKIIDILSNTVFKNVKIFRLLCATTGKTISLLPSPLIPYSRFTITSFLTIIYKFLTHKGRIIDASCEMYNYFNFVSDFCFESCYFYNYIKIFKNTIQKLNIFIKTKQKTNIHFSNTKEDWLLAYNFIVSFIDPKSNIKDNLAIDWHYYNTYGGFAKNAPFLFGKPFQHLRNRQ